MFEFTRNFYSPIEEGDKIPEEKPAPKVFTFLKGRTIVSELSRLNKAFGNISKKQTIIGQLSDIADAAEAGKIGGDGVLIVRANFVSGGTYNVILDKTWQEIHDALKTSSVYVILENESVPMIKRGRIVEAGYNEDDAKYAVKVQNGTMGKANSPNDYPTAALD